MSTEHAHAAELLGAYEGRSELRGFHPDGSPHTEAPRAQRVTIGADAAGVFLDLRFGRVRLEPYSATSAWVLVSSHETAGPGGEPITVHVRGGLVTLVRGALTYSFGVTLKRPGRPRIDGYATFDGALEANAPAREALH